MRRRAAFLLLALLTALAACRKAAPPPPVKIAPVVEAKAPAVRFEDVTERTGIAFTHVNGASGKKWMPETMGGGVVIFDYDNDGRNDVLLVSSSYWPGDPRAKTQKSSLSLWHNEGNGPDGVPRFRDATKEAGLQVVLYGMGATAADFDGDGWVDLYVTGLGSMGGNRLFRNVRGHFRDVTASSGTGDPGWGTSAAFFDYDGDGKPDLFLARYVDWTPAKDIFCTLDGTKKSYCTPERYDGTFSRLFHNEGNGKFRDATKAAGVGTTNAKALGVAPWDFDGDGKIDFAVANDTAPNNLYRNNGNGTFTDVAVEAGVAVNEAGRSRGAMGVDWSDARPGGAALAIGNFSNEMKSFYWTDTGDVFLDLSASSGIGRDSLLALTFGVFFFDYDLDGRSDLFFSNGHVENAIQDVQKAVSYREAPTLYWNAGDGKMSDATAAAGLSIPMVGRGAAYGDLDGDGDLDVVVVENGGPAHVFLNRLDQPSRSLRITLEGTGKSNRDAIGAKVTATVGGKPQVRIVSTAKSYASASEKTLTFGLGDHGAAESVDVTWPDGTKAQARNVGPGQYRWVEGSELGKL
ncbi:MAG TPA: CRTAC1 family protein [Thermoanaerobaculia bacterium]|nr:CRTAC1 family protein [Thermoanaerobaculia bacterium]